MDTRRLLTIAAIALLVLGLGVGIYFYFFSGGAGVTVAPGGTGNLPIAGQTPPVGGTGTGGTTPSPSAAGPVMVSPRLVQISAGQIVPGVVVVDRKAANASSTPEVAVSYIARESGNVFTYLTQARTLTRVNNKTIPGIQSASWLPDGSIAFVRYLSGNDFSTINTYALAATSTTGFFLPQNLTGITTSATGLLTVASGINGSAIAQSRTDGTHSTTLFTTPLASLRASFAGKGTYLVFSKPSAGLSGDAFITDGSGRLSRIAGPLPGLVALASPSGKKVLVSYARNNTMQTELVDIATGVVTTLPVSTIADKCVWTNDDLAVYCGVPMNPDASYAYPDDWYQSAVSFNDRIWKIDVAGRYAQLVLDFSQTAGGALDAEALAVDPAKSMLVFVNKNDGSLWGYSL